ncbi:TSC22 domain family protein 4-like isoform X2 [Stegostoma tigrinum]|uniref:TSC22 domain family protein 4-like isoform X2 n=1 Tax=Stegostoma tigrinum TaxID=3053191 RepID=UPI00202B498C|nr:TSC22 domain family protein 4-like isoform X2 [Stegostoma tigrinum]
MIGKKKSGFQITSVTSDYDSGSGEGLKEPLNGEAEAGRPATINGGLGFSSSTETELLVKDDRTKPAMTGQPAASREASEVPKEAGPAGVLPGTRSPPPPAPSPCSSRFRVVKLDHGLGEPYRRGRWTCVDLYDRELDSHGLAKVLDSGRHVNSLDSHPDFGALIAHRAVSQLWPRPHAPKSQGSPLGEAPRARAADTLHVLLQAAKTLSLDSPPGTAAPVVVPSSSSPSPPQPHGAPSTSGNASVTPQEKGDVAARPHPANQPHGAKAGAAETASPPPEQPPSNVKQPSSGDQGGLRKDGSPSRKTRASEPSAASSLRFVSPMQTLAKSMLSVGTHPDSDDDSGSSSSMVAIDNKIEQAMDLVKSHLMYAVREEVEVLKEQIKELVDRNALLERENALLKSLANPEQLSQLQAQLRSTGSTVTGSSGSSPASTA